MIWQASNSSWQCTNPVTNPLGQLSCSLDQSIRWNGTAWACVDMTKVFSLARNTTWPQGGGFFGPTIADVFPLLSGGVDGTTPCESSFLCTISFVNVSDHRTCTYTSVGSTGPMPDPVRFEQGIEFFDLDRTFEGSPSMSLTFFCS